MVIEGINWSIIRSYGAIKAPFDEAKRHYQVALFPVHEKGEPRSLTERVSHISAALLLLFPGVNYVLYIAMRYFHFDLGHYFVNALEKEGLEQLKHYLNMGWDPNQRANGGKPLILIAYEKNNLDSLRILLENGADPNLSYGSETLLHRAASEGKEEIVDLLLEKGANPNCKCAHMTAAYMAYRNQHEDLVLKIAKAGNGINDTVDHAQNSLFNHVWTDQNYSFLVRLIEAGAKPPKTHPISGYAIFCELYCHAKDLPLKMIDLGWNVNASIKSGERFLDFVIQNQDWTLARKLVEKGADIRLKKPLVFDQLKDDQEYFLNFLGFGPLCLQTTQNLVNACPALSQNPLEIIYFMGDERRIRELSIHLTYREFNHYFADLKTKYPRILIARILDALFDPKYQNAKSITIPKERKKPEGTLYLSKLQRWFASLDLNDNELIQNGRVYTREELQEGLLSFAKKVKRDNSELGLQHKALLEQIINNLTEENAKALVDLAFACINQEDPSLSLYQTYRQVLKLNPSFEDHVKHFLGQYRVDLVKEIFPSNQHGLVLAVLMKSRQLSYNTWQRFEAENQKEIEEQFDRYYTPSAIIKAMMNKVRTDVYFKGELYHWTRNHFSEHWLQSTDVMDAGDLFEDPVLPLGIGIILKYLGQLDYQHPNSFLKTFNQPSFFSIFTGGFLGG